MLTDRQHSPIAPNDVANDNSNEAKARNAIDLRMFIFHISKNLLMRKGGCDFECGYQKVLRDHDDKI